MNATLKAAEVQLAEDWADSMDPGLVARLENRIQSYQPGVALHVEVRYGEADMVREYLEGRLREVLGETGSINVTAKAPRKFLNEDAETMTAGALESMLDAMVIRNETVHLATGDRFVMVDGKNVPPKWQAQLAPALMDHPMPLEKLLRWMQGSGMQHIVDVEMAEAEQELGREMTAEDREKATLQLMGMKWKGAFVDQADLKDKGELGKAAEMINTLAHDTTDGRLVPLEVLEALFNEDSRLELVEISDGSLRWSKNFRALVLTSDDRVVYLKRGENVMGDLERDTPASMYVEGEKLTLGGSVALRETKEELLINDGNVSKVWFLLEKGDRMAKEGIVGRV